ncbi:MAG: hypothetical protein PHR20_01375 [Bacteroidales bacterium]|nr:hypothetical protein [Bacteroidales bacterium]
MERLINSRIDKGLWDRAVEESFSPRVYHYSWYLDIVSPQWEALVTENYDNCFVLPLKKKYGISYIVQPFIVQQLGSFGREFSRDFFIGSMRYIRKHFIYRNIRLSEADTKLVVKDKRLSKHTAVHNNIILNLVTSEEKPSYSSNTLRNIKKFYSQEGCSVEAGVNYDRVIDLFKAKQGHDYGVTVSQYDMLCRVFQEAFMRHKLCVYSAMEGDNIIAGAVFLECGGVWTFIFSGNSVRGKECGAMHALIDKFLSDRLGLIRMLDFEGSDNPGLARFYRGFGAKEVSYCSYREMF